MGNLTSPVPSKMMERSLRCPITYLISSGATTADSNTASKDFRDILVLVAAAVHAGVSLIQLREKNLSAKMLYELASRCAAITRKSETQLLINDRADIARAVHADGVHLSTRSVEAGTIRRAFGNSFSIGVSTHNLDEAQSAREAGADFVVFGPVFDTPSKHGILAPAGVEELARVARELFPFPVIAIGGVTKDNMAAALGAGARGIAAIRLFSDPQSLESTIASIRNASSAR